MGLKVWNSRAWDRMIAKHPKLGVKPEGVAFSAAALEAGCQGLTEVQENAKALKVKLLFSGASIGSARNCMGMGKKTKKKSKAAKRKGGGKKRGRPVGSRNRRTAGRGVGRRGAGLPLDIAIDRVAAVESELDALKETLTNLRTALYGV